MSSAFINRIILCKKKNLINLVLDIEKYKEFVPWCLDSIVHERKDMEVGTEIKADLKVGKRFLNETYSSLVLYSKKKDLISVTNLDGPLKYLKNEWKFTEINNKTLLKFSINFELKNNFLNLIMKNSINFGLNKIADAFEQRAIKLFK
jgi:coenzyme Q-binding protein COQ10